MATPPADIVEQPGREEDTVHPSLAVNALERLALHELFSPRSGVTNVHGTSFTQKAGNLRLGKVEIFQAFVLEQPQLSLPNR